MWRLLLFALVLLPAGCSAPAAVLTATRAAAVSRATATMVPTPLRLARCAWEPVPAQHLANGLYAGADVFFRQRADLGTVIEFKDAPDWANGQRQYVTTNKAAYLVYLCADDVVGVYKYNSEGGRDSIYHVEVPTPPANIQAPPSVDLPAYTIISQFRLISGGNYAGILCESLSRGSPAAERERVLRGIAAKEGFVEASLYSTRDAYQANISATFLKQHPTALKEGLLGSLRNGQFTAAETLYP